MHVLLKKVPLFLVALFVTSAVCADSGLVESSCNAHVISLGPKCEVGVMRRVFKIDSPYYPFDFMTTTNFTVVCDIIEKRFAGFFDRNNLKFWRKRYINTKYNGLEFNHEFSDAHPFDSYYQHEFEKYQRRIDRFHEVLQSAKPVFFFRRSVEYKDALRFCNLIQKFSPQLNFLLIVINGGEKKKIKDYTLPLVRKFNVTPRRWPEWHTPEHLCEWHDVFLALGLLPKEVSIERTAVMPLSEDIFWNLNHE